MVAALIISPFLAAVLALSLARRHRSQRPAVAVPEPAHVAVTAPGRPDVQPSSAATGPFGYDNGLAVESGEGP